MMRKIYRLICLTIISVFITALASQSGALGRSQYVLGNTDLNIQNGGIMLQDGDTIYYSGDGIWTSVNGQEKRINAENGRNLNLADDYIYYTADGGQVRRIPKDGGEPQEVYSHPSEISQLYVINGNTLRFISDGSAWELVLESAEPRQITGPRDIHSLIPTQYGDLFLSGDIFDYKLYAGENKLLQSITGCYTDSGYLVVTQETDTYQVSLEKLFSGFDAARDLEPFDLHGSVSMALLFNSDDETKLCPVCDAYIGNEADARQAEPAVSLMDEPGVTLPPVSQGQRNIVLRARQQSEIKWTPLEDRYQWGYRGVFTAGTTYTGVPYGQPVNTGYVPWTISFSDFLASVNNNSSTFYTKYSEYNKIAPCYSSDCSSYVSYAWGLKSRMTTYSIPSVATRVSNQSIYSAQVGDCFNHQTSHVVLVSGIGYDESGNIITMEIMEQTPVITKYTKYGVGGTNTLAYLQQYYLGGGYVLYRNPQRDSVVYTHNCAVAINGDYCASCKETVPNAKIESVTGGKSVSLSHSDSQAVIYYTTDGSTPTTSSAVYSAPIKFYGASKLRAIAVSKSFSGSQILEYSIKLSKSDAPTASAVSGISSGSYISKGSTVELKSTSAGATIRYTTDGTEPTEASPAYSSPISINADTVIKAYAVGLGMSKSDVSTISYKIAQVYKISATAGTGGTCTPSGSVGALEGTDAKFTFSPAEGYSIESVKVDGISIGAVSSYTFQGISADHSVSVSFKKENYLPFTDVSESDWHYDAVGRVYAKGYFSGTSSTNFSPEGLMTRGMFVTVIGRMAGVSGNLGSNVGIVIGDGVRIRKAPNTDSEILGVCNKYTAVKVLSDSGGWHNIQHGSITGYIRNDLIKSSGVNWNDLPPGQYYTSHAKWAGLMGIVSGTSQTSFSPNNNITREQACVILYNYAQKYGMTLPSVNTNIKFADDSSISSWAKTAVYAMQKSGIISGMGDGKFNPQSHATRAQVAQILVNFMDTVS